MSSGRRGSSTLAAPPASVDLRQPWWDIGDQEGTGSCVGWASTDGVARYHFVKANRLAQNAKLSPRFTWMASKETDEFISRPETMIEGAGTSLKAAVDILRKYGAVPETLMPFHITDQHVPGRREHLLRHRRDAQDRFLCQPAAQSGELADLAGQQRADPGRRSTWTNLGQRDRDPGQARHLQPATVRGGHASAVSAIPTKGRFIIRNSWGTAWGDKGFAYASEAYINAGFFNESYGVTI